MIVELKRSVVEINFVYKEKYMSLRVYSDSRSRLTDWNKNKGILSKDERLKLKHLVFNTFKEDINNRKI